METREIIGQTLGIIGMACMCISYQWKKSSSVFLLQLIACLLFTVHFVFLQAYTGLILNGIEVVRSYLLYREDKPWTSKKPVIWGMTALLCFAGIITWEGWYSLFPVIAVTVSTPILWTRDPKKIRYAGLFCVSPCWLIYNIVVFTIGGIITESLSIISVIVSFIRYKGFKEA